MAPFFKKDVKRTVRKQELTRTIYLLILNKEHKNNSVDINELEINKKDACQLATILYIIENTGTFELT